MEQLCCWLSAQTHLQYVQYKYMYKTTCTICPSFTVLWRSHYWAFIIFIFWCFYQNVHDFTLCFSFQFLYSVTSCALEQLQVPQLLFSIVVHCVYMRGSSVVCMWACVCMQFRVGAFIRMCYSMQTSTLLHNQITPVFISGMINGLGRMEAESTKDSFGYLTIFYV